MAGKFAGHGTTNPELQVPGKEGRVCSQGSHIVRVCSQCQMVRKKNIEFFRLYAPSEFLRPLIFQAVTKLHRLQERRTNSPSKQLFPHSAPGHVFSWKNMCCESKCKSPIHTLNPQADPYPRSRPKCRWSRPIQTSGSPRADPYPNFDAQPYPKMSSKRSLWNSLH